MPGDLLPHLLSCIDALASDTPPGVAFAAADRGLKAVIGHGLFTVLKTTDDGAIVERIYSSDPAHYPLAGRKAMGPTPWGDLVLTQGRPFVGSEVAAIRWAFPDHELIESLGLGATISVPAKHRGRVLGTLNILDRAGSYQDPTALDIARVFAALLVPAFTENPVP